MIYLFLADGFEEAEAFVPYDILHRGGEEILKVGVTGEYVTSSHNVTVKSDISLSEAAKSEPDMVILPGGMPGTTNLDENETVREIVKKAYEGGKVVGAICAAPSILGKMGILKGRKATCFPSFEKWLDGAQYVRDYCVHDGNVITACGAGGAYQFGFELLGTIDEKKAEEVKKSMQYVL
jgi:4-methyl-5(b-hydroxyethyl)-thiazole monophosphate biosynthesis